ncbi:MAG TPA: DUF998 domain-containing protein [Mucilaginibacter sp.]|nr:DUF998 domain-containing protein [Mucilaginibacter sp.]
MNKPDTVANVTALRTPLHTFLLCCGFSGGILFSIINFSFGAITPHYDMMRQPINELELIRHGWIQSANFVVLGLFVCAYALGLRKELVSGFGATLIPLSQLFLAAGFILTGLFIHQPMNNIAGAISFMAMLSSFLLFAIRFARDARWKGWAAYTVLSAVLIIAAIALFGYTQQRDAPYAAMFERLVILVRMVWALVFLLRLLNGRRLGPVKQGATSPVLTEQAEHAGE